jgi:hypothetical protein
LQAKSSVASICFAAKCKFQRTTDKGQPTTMFVDAARHVEGVTQKSTHPSQNEGCGTHKFSSVT